MDITGTCRSHLSHTVARGVKFLAVFGFSLFLLFGATAADPSNGMDLFGPDENASESAAQIGGRVWVGDLDPRRSQDQIPMRHAQVGLFDCDGQYLRSTMTDDQGTYLFADLSDGCYRTRIRTVSGYRMPRQPGNAQTGIDPTTGTSDVIELSGGQSRLDINVAMTRPQHSEIGDRVWEDKNANGIQDVGEPGLAGVTITLYYCDGSAAYDAQGRTRSVTSEANGDYLFTDLKPDCYTVRFSADDDFSLSPALIGNPATDSDASGTVAGFESPVSELEPLTSDYNIDSGFYQNATLGNLVWLDSDGDGLQSPGETGVADVTIMLLDERGVPAGPITTTDTEGGYAFYNIKPGRYMLQFVLPANYVASPSKRGANASIDSDANAKGITAPFELSSAQRQIDLDFGVRRLGGLGISIEKSTNGLDADTAPGPLVLAGDPVTWLYDVMNIGNETLFFIEVTDDQGVVVTCPSSILNPTGEMTCTAPAGTAQPDQYTNIATVIGNDGSDEPTEVSAQDTSHYFGAVPFVTLQKLSNGADADTPPGPTIAVGDPVDFQYVVNNTGNVEINNIVVVDDQGVAVVCPSDTLPAGQQMTCSGASVVTRGQYMNIGTVTADPVIGDPLSASDPSHHIGTLISVNIEKATNGFDADTAPGPYIAAGEPVTWTYIVTNDGDETLGSAVVIDSQGVALTCDNNFLEPGEFFTCTGTGTASAGQYMNVAEVCAFTVDIEGEICDSDPSHYFGESGTLSIEKSTNGEDADVAPGPYVAPGSTVNWVYVVTNNSNVVVTDLSVTDSQGVVVTCAVFTLAPGATTSCTASGLATAGQYQNIGTVTGTTPGGNTLSGSDPSHYFGETGSLTIEKTTNGEDADVAPGPYVEIGSTVNWVYVVTNNSNVEVSNVSVTDDQGVTVSCPTDTIAAGATLTCTASGTAIAGQYANIGTVNGTTPGGTPLTNSDPSHYFGETGTLSIEKSTNGEDADVAPGPYVQIGSTVNWVYVLTNNSNVELNNVSVTDSQGVTVSCPADTIGAGATLICTASGTATAGQYQNIGTANGTTPSGNTLTGSDPSHYFGETGTLSIEKSTNGQDADVAPGPSVELGSTVNWVYVVTNNSNVEVSNVSVTDDQGVTVSCPTDTIAAGATLTCTASGTAIAGQYANIGTVNGTTPGGTPLTNSDPSHYFGETGTLSIEKSTNGEDADVAPGPYVQIGSTVNWVYVLTNNSNVELNNVSVTDSQGVTVSCPADTIGAGATLICTASGTATAGQYQNIGTANGTTPSGNTLTGSDPSHYFGETGTLSIEKSTNGQDADVAPGPSVELGSTVNWVYVVTNNSNVEVSNVSVTDDQGVTVSCPTDTIAAGATLTCTASGTAIAGQYANIGTVNGTTPGGTPLTNSDPSHYFGETGTLSIEKSTNGEDADVAPGPYVQIGSTVNWVYVLTNNSNVELNNVSVTDSQGVTVSCPADTIGAGATLICTASGTATAGQYQNIGTANGTTPSGNTLTGSDPSHYFGETGTLAIEKSTNGEDADVAPGPSVTVGSTVNWVYVLTNTSNVDLTNVSVTDSQGVTVTCPADTIGVGATLICTASGTAIAGQYENIGMATGTTPSGNTLTGSDPSHYFGETGTLSIEKTTNGEDADAAPGPYIAVGSMVSWVYTVTNNSNVELTNVNVTDSQGVTVNCPSNTLGAGQTLICTASGVATAGQYENIGTAIGTTPGGATLTGSDPSHYFGQITALSIEKLTNGVDADAVPGPSVEVGSTVNWVYIVTNDSNVELSNVIVTDDQGVAVDCPADTVGAGLTLICTGSGTAIAGQYANIGTVTGTTPGGTPLTASDPSHYFGETGTLSIEKTTNGEDADVAPGPYIPAGSTVTWVYTLTNNSNVDLTNVSVTDSQGVTVNCPTNTLGAGQTLVCMATGTATAGQYQNIGTANGTTPSGNTLTGSDPSHYFGESGLLSIEKSTNGEDADVAPGPYLLAGTKVNWEYEVTNNSNVELTNVIVTDNQGVMVTCPSDTLGAGQSMTCMAAGKSVDGQYQNIGTVMGATPSGATLTATDPSHYFGEMGILSIEKSTNGEDADVAPGPFVQIGSTVNWVYVLTNNSNVELSNVSVTDSQGVTVSCPADTIGAGATLICTASGTATAGQYENIGTANGTTPSGNTLTGSDPSHYFGEMGILSIEKSTNGEDADVAPGPSVEVGSPVNWIYVVTNNSNVEVSNVSVTDDQGVTVSCPTDTIGAGATLTCTASGTAIAGQYANIGTVNGTTPGGDTLTGSDPSHYFGETGTLSIEKTTNGEDADVAPGPYLALGSPVTWLYTLTNNSNVDLSNVSVTDSQGVMVSCPADTIGAGMTLVCTASGIAIAGQYENIGTANGTTPSGNTLTGSDPSHYFGEMGMLSIEKSTNGQDADVAPGPSVEVGSTVNWIYVVTNNSNVAVSNVSVTDDQGVAVSCPTDTIAASATLTCNASGMAIAGQYANIGTVNGTTPGGDTLTDSDPSHYFGESAGLTIEKSTNGEDADTAPGPYLSEGAPVEWLYEVTNNSNVAVTGLVVVDDQGVIVTCPSDTIGAGLSIVCTGSGVAMAGQYANVGTANAITLGGAVVSDNDPSHYFGEKGTLSIEKSTNGEDADSAPGPSIAVGDAVTWDYLLTNNSNVTLVGINVNDSQGVAVVCPATTLDAGMSMNCTASGVATAGQYMNLGTVTGTTPGGTTLSGTDPSHYFGSAQCQNGDVADDFSVVSFSNNTGSMNWSGGWTEHDPRGGGASSGSVMIANGQLILNDYPDSGQHPSISREVDLSGYVAAMLMFDWATSDEANTDDDAVIELSADGGVTWVVLDQFEGDSNGTSGSEMYDITAYMSANTRIRFRIEQKFGGAWDKFMVDNVRIDKKCEFTCVVSSAPDHGLWIPNFNDDGQLDRFDFEPGAEFIQRDDGTATLIGLARDQNDSARALMVNVTLAGRTDIPPPGSPKNTFGADVADWMYYPIWDGTLTGVDAYAGTVVTLTRRGPAFQIGTGANDQPGEQDIYGGSAWFDFQTDVQPDACGNSGDYCLTHTGDGDINVRIDCATVQSCSATGGGLELRDDEIRWELTNNEDEPLFLETLSVSWPDQHDKLKEVKLRDRIYQTERNGPSIELGPADWIGSASRRRIDPGQTLELKIKFTEDYKDATQDDYALTVVFDGGCTVVFIPGSGPFECDKPIDEISMIWDGTQNVRIKAYKGDTDEPLLADIDSISVGDEVAVNGLAGSPNDVYWEVFAAGSNTKIGESKYHLSCSDDDMDGAEDCGKRQGNGKDNNGGFINDWLLDGMVDQSGSFDCTP